MPLRGQSASQLAIISLRNGNVERAESALNEQFRFANRHRLNTRRPSPGCFTIERISNISIAVPMKRRHWKFAANWIQRQRAEQLVGRDHLEIARILTSQARMLISDFSYAEAEGLLDQAPGFARVNWGPFIQMFPNHCSNWRGSMRIANTMTKPMKGSVRSSRSEKRNVVRIILTSPMPCFSTPIFLCTTARMAKAGSMLRRALEIWTDTGGLDHPWSHEKRDLSAKCCRANRYPVLTLLIESELCSPA